MSAKDASGSAPQHSHPHNNTMSCNEKFWVDPVTVPHPPLGNDKGWGTTRGGGGGHHGLVPPPTPHSAPQVRLWQASLMTHWLTNEMHTLPFPPSPLQTTPAEATSSSP